MTERPETSGWSWFESRGPRFVILGLSESRRNSRKYGMIYFLVFIACLAIEFLYIRQTKSIVADQISATMLWTGTLHLIGKLSTVMLVANPWTIIPAVLGHVSGTYLGMWFRREQKRRG